MAVYPQVPLEAIILSFLPLKLSGCRSRPGSLSGRREHPYYGSRELSDHGRCTRHRRTIKIRMTIPAVAALKPNIHSGLNMVQSTPPIALATKLPAQPQFMDFN